MTSSLPANDDVVTPPWRALGQAGVLRLDDGGESTPDAFLEYRGACEGGQTGGEPQLREAERPSSAEARRTTTAEFTEARRATGVIVEGAAARAELVYERCAGLLGPAPGRATAVPRRVEGRFLWRTGRAVPIGDRST
jgi:hypothetical protein